MLIEKQKANMPPKKGAASSSNPKPTERRVMLPGTNQARVVYVGPRGGIYIRHKNQFVSVSQLAHLSRESQLKSKPKSNKPRKQRGGAQCGTPQACYDAFMEQYELLMGDADNALRHIEEHRDLNDIDVMNEYVELVQLVLDDIADAKHFYASINLPESEEGVRLQLRVKGRKDELLDLEATLQRILDVPIHASSSQQSSHSSKDASVSFQDWVNNHRK